MASLLYRLGRAAARRAWLVVTAWLVLLGLAVGAFLAFGGTLTSQVTIPGTATEEVQDQLADGFPAASGGSGTIVFHTEDGSAFTDEQEAEISELLASLPDDVDGVKGAVDPFATQQQLADQEAQLTAGEQQIADGRTQLEQGQQQLDAAQAQLDAGQQQLDAARAQAEAAGQLAAAQAQLDAQQQQIDQGQAQLDEQATQLATGRTDLEANAATTEDARTLLDLAENIRQVSTDDSTALGTVQFDAGTFDVTPETKTAVVDAVEASPVDGVEVEFSQDITQSIPSILGPGEVVGVVIAAITLFVMLGTLIGAGLPLVNALIGVGVGVAGSLSLSGVVDMLSVTPVLGVMLGLAVGIDYSLFILNRHRNQLKAGADLHESIGLANGTSGNAVVFAGTTVIIALLALNVTGIPFLGLMGTVAAVCVAVAILVAVTLTPALLRLVGMRLLPKKARAQVGRTGAVRVPSKPMSTVRAVVTLVAGLAVLLVVALPALSMRLGLPAASSQPVDSTQYKAYQLTDEAFGEGANGPLVVVADLPQAVSDDDLVGEQARIGQAIGDVPDVAAVAPIGASDDDTLLAFQVLPEEGPTAVSTEQLVNALRDTTLDGEGGDVTLGVAGTASANIDISEKLGAVLPLYLVVVVGLSLLILVLVFRSILVPITATLGFVLSVLAAFGGVTAIYQFGWLSGVFGVHDPGPVLSFLPILLVGILFGLAMDYQLFLVSGMREAYAHGASAKVAVQRGVHAGRTVVIAAAIIMISVFGGFIFSHDIIIQSLGFGLAFGVLVDAFVVRLLLIPAVMHLLGRSAWWLPRWLDRILPDVDVEGAKLEREHPGGAATGADGEREERELVGAGAGAGAAGAAGAGVAGAGAGAGAGAAGAGAGAGAAGSDAGAAGADTSQGRHGAHAAPVEPDQGGVRPDDGHGAHAAPVDPDAGATGADAGSGSPVDGGSGATGHGAHAAPVAPDQDADGHDDGHPPAHRA